MSRAPAVASGFVTLQMIADHANVSCTTVSLALRNHPKISVATRERVHALARELDYRVNPLVSAHMSYLRALRPNYTGVCIAFVCNRPLGAVKADTRTPVRHYYHSARRRAVDLGFELEYFNVAENGMTDRRLSQILAARGIRGVIVAPLSEGAGVSGVMLDWGEFASVMIEHTFLQPRVHTVCSDEFSTIGRLIQRLLDYGNERIGIAMHSRMDDHANHFWLAGYQAFQALTKACHRVPHFITPRWEKRAFLAWFKRRRPTAIITINDDIVRWLREDGVRVPEDVACATLYWKADRPELSGYDQNHELIAAAAVDMIVSQLNRNERGLPSAEKTMMIQAVWKEGATVRRKTPPDSLAPLRVWTR